MKVAKIWLPRESDSTQSKHGSVIFIRQKFTNSEWNVPNVCENSSLELIRKTVITFTYQVQREYFKQRTVLMSPEFGTNLFSKKLSRTHFSNSKIKLRTRRHIAVWTKPYKSYSKSIREGNKTLSWTGYFVKKWDRQNKMSMSIWKWKSKETCLYHWKV